MSTLIVQGGKRLNGSIKAQGAKNEILQILCAAIITDEDVLISNVPEIEDVKILLQIIQNLGCNVTFLQRDKLLLQTKVINEDYLNSDDYLTLSSKIRGSVMLLGALLARLNYSIIANPGGDRIGRRGIEVHLNGLQKLGVNYNSGDHRYHRIESEKLKGGLIWLKEASVTGTANCVMAAVLAEGDTVIYNAACEPYVQQLCNFLVSLGAKIKGIGSNRLEIFGVTHLHGGEHNVQADMIEIGSFIGVAAVTKSKLEITGTLNSDLGVMLDYFKLLGIDITQAEDSIVVDAREGYEIARTVDESILTIYDSPWPGLSPDIISVLLTTAVYAEGTLLIHQKMFESRLFFTDKLISMGAKIILCDPHRAVVIGNGFDYRLRPGILSSPDIRAGMSLLMAALSAEGQTTINNAHQIDRGYERIVERLSKLGADITRL